MTKDYYFDIIYNRIGSLFRELLFIARQEFSSSELINTSDAKYFNYYINILIKYSNSYTKSFDESWNTKRKVQYIYEDIRSFFRQFENPFLNSSRWYKRALYLLESLAKEQEALNDLIENDGI